MVETQHAAGGVSVQERAPVAAPRVVDASASPARLHHYNFTSKDAEKTRAFYEDLLGIPMVVFWVEVIPHPGSTDTTILGHAFYGLNDGSMLAFMTYPDADAHAAAAAIPQPDSVHIALSVTAEVKANTLTRLRAAGHKVLEIDHGFIESIYFRDPDGLTIEYSVDPEDTDKIYGEQKAGLAHANFKRFLDGDYTRTQKWFPDNGLVPEYK